MTPSSLARPDSTTRNFDLQLAIAPSDCPNELYVETEAILVVQSGNRAGLCSRPRGLKGCSVRFDLDQAAKGVEQGRGTSVPALVQNARQRSLKHPSRVR
jgi:hypothetical protein